MRTVSHGGGYRTKLMTEQRARVVAAMYAANPRFTGAAAHRADRAKTERSWFVFFQPASADRQRELRAGLQAIQDERAEAQWMNYVVTATENPAVFDVENQETGEPYQVHLHAAAGSTCTCPHFEERCERAQVTCKHVGIVRLHQVYGLVQPAPRVLPSPAAVAAQSRRDLVRSRMAVDFPDY